MNPKIVGAHNPTKIASSLLPFMYTYSETTIIDSTTSSIKKFAAPTFLIKLLIIYVNIVLGNLVILEQKSIIIKN